MTDISEQMIAIKKGENPIGLSPFEKINHPLSYRLVSKGHW
jgi:hypothetical protein